jgi:hypothetical protein
MLEAIIIPHDTISFTISDRNSERVKNWVYESFPNQMSLQLRLKADGHARMGEFDAKGGVLNLKCRQKFHRDPSPARYASCFLRDSDLRITPCLEKKANFSPLRTFRAPNPAQLKEPLTFQLDFFARSRL